MIQIDYNKVVFSKNIVELQSLHKKSVSGNLSFSDNAIINNLEFGRTYYMFYNNKLVAFKILAFSVTNGVYLVKTPNDFHWLELRNYRLFNTKEEYFLYLENKCKPIILETSVIDLCNIPTINNRYCGGSMELRNSYKWNKGLGKPIQDISYMYEVLFVNDGFVVYYKLREDCYDTYEQCLQANLNGMEIEEFAEEMSFPTIEITFKTETKPKIHTLRFIED